VIRKQAIGELSLSLIKIKKSNVSLPKAISKIFHVQLVPIEMA